MNISHDEIKADSKVLAEAAMSSSSTVPSFFLPLSYLKYHFAVYIVFAALSFFLPDMSGDSLIGLGVLGFGLLNWLFIFGLASGYVSLFAMVSNPDVKGLKLTKVISSKLKAYGIVWFCLLVVLGLASINTGLSIAVLVFGNFILTIFGLFILNIDLSRFQLSGLIGAASAIKTHYGN